MNDTARRVVGVIAALVIIGLPVADFIRRGEVSTGMLAALVVLAFGGAGFQFDRFLQDRLNVEIRLKDKDDERHDS